MYCRSFEHVIPEKVVVLYRLFLGGKVGIIGEFKLGFSITFERLEVDNEIILDSKDRVVLKMWILTRIKLSNNGVVVGMRNHDVHVSRAPGRSVHSRKKNPGRTFSRKRISSGLKAVEVVFSLLVGLELATEIVVCLFLILKVILSVGAGLPDIEDGVSDGLFSIRVHDTAVHKSNFSLVGAHDDGTTVLTERGFGAPERSQNGGRSWLDLALKESHVGHFVKESLKTENIRDTVAFIACGLVDLTNRVDEFHALEPFFNSKIDFTSKGVEVLDKSRENFLLSGLGVRSHSVHDGLSENIQVKHFEGGLKFCFG